MTDINFNMQLGRSLIRASLFEGDVCVVALAEKMNWSFQRVYSQMKTIAKKEKKQLIKVKKGVFKLAVVEINNE